MLIYNIEFSNDAVISNLKRLINQIYKLLPCREENTDWETPLDTIIEELLGMSKLIPEQHELLFSLLCKLQGLKELTNEEDFGLYRRILFDCLNILSKIRENIIEEA